MAAHACRAAARWQELLERLHAGGALEKLAAAIWPKLEILKVRRLEGRMGARPGREHARSARTVKSCAGAGETKDLDLALVPEAPNGLI